MCAGYATSPKSSGCYNLCPSLSRTRSRSRAGAQRKVSVPAGRLGLGSLLASTQYVSCRPKAMTDKHELE